MLIGYYNVLITRDTLPVKDTNGTTLVISNAILISRGTPVEQRYPVIARITPRINHDNGIHVSGKGRSNTAHRKLANSI